MNENELVLKPINDLLKEHFYVPSYQRGYRWTPTQVKALLDDIWKFRRESQNGKPESFYCLQPVVVAQSDKGWVMIDGQQRLTTIHLMLTYLKEGLTFLSKEKFTLAYETRPGSEAFLNEIDLARQEENIDYHHMCRAYQTIQEWFTAKEGTARINFLTTLLNSDEEGKNVKVIWYEVKENGASDHIDIFTRLNIGKIPLTNAELIKALFLKKDNFQTDKVNLKQLQIASEWDAIEQKLQDDAFWLFIYDTNSRMAYSNRIEYLFDLMTGKKYEDENYFTFNRFAEKFAASAGTGNKPDIDALWLEVKKYFLTFDEWYQNRTLFHYVGFLIDCDHDIRTLKEAAEGHTKTDFKNWLKDQIRQEVNCDLNDLSYERPKDQALIKKVLLLFNLQSILSTQTADMRFPFHRYKGVPWDIEHVRSQTDKKIKGKARRDWLLDVQAYFTGIKGYSTPQQKEQQQEIADSLEEPGKRFCQRIISLLNADEIDEAGFESLYTQVVKHFKEDSQPENIHGLSNLALLDPKTNRSYKNAPFPIKRSVILDNDMKGYFIPLCTKNLFLKSYSRQMGEIWHWKQEDADAYLQVIKNTLTDFLPQNRNHDRA